MDLFILLRAVVLSFINITPGLDMVPHTCKASTRDAGAGVLLWIQGQLELQRVSSRPVLNCTVRLSLQRYKNKNYSLSKICNLAHWIIKALFPTKLGIFCFMFFVKTLVIIRYIFGWQTFFVFDIYRVKRHFCSKVFMYTNSSGGKTS